MNFNINFVFGGGGGEGLEDESEVKILGMWRVVINVFVERSFPQKPWVGWWGGWAEQIHTQR